MNSRGIKPADFRVDTRQILYFFNFRRFKTQNVKSFGDQVNIYIPSELQPEPRIIYRFCYSLFSFFCNRVN